MCVVVVGGVCVGGVGVPLASFSPVPSFSHLSLSFVAAAG